MNIENEELFKHIFYSYAKGILRFLSASVSCKEDAEDILQEVFLACLKNFDELFSNPDTDYEKWLFAVARNQLLDYYKHKKRHAPPLSYDDADFTSILSHEVDYIGVISDKDLLPDDIIVSQVLSKLSEKDRQLYEFVYIKKISYTELASMYNTNEPTIRMRVSRLKYRINTSLKDYLK